MRVIVLGSGRVGAAIARDLAGSDAFEVTVADISERALARLSDVPRLERQRLDLSAREELRRAVAAHELVVGAVPGPMGFETVRRVLEAERDIVDISFFEEDAFELDALAREVERTAIVDCGVAPGFSNLVLGDLERELDAVERFHCVVGGLPSVRHWPYEYRAPFSPIDVIAEYTRPARIRRGGQEITLPALSEVELLDFDGVGTLEAFNTDGLRTLLYTAEVPDMVEKTLRYPGHAERMRMLSETGFFAEAPLRVGTAEVRPLDLTAALLFEAWSFREGEEDLTVMRVEVDGRTDGRTVRHVWSLLDRHDRTTGISSMARTTGYTCTAAVRLLAEGRYRRPGISPPEYIGREPGCLDFVVDHLRQRGVAWRHDVV